MEKIEVFSVHRRGGQSKSCRRNGEEGFGGDALSGWELVFTGVFESEKEAVERNVGVSVIVELDPERGIVGSCDFVDGERKRGGIGGGRIFVRGIDFDLVEPGIVHYSGEGIKAEVARGHFGQAVG